MPKFTVEKVDLKDKPYPSRLINVTPHPWSLITNDKTITYLVAFSHHGMLDSLASLSNHFVNTNIL